MDGHALDRQRAPALHDVAGRCARQDVDSDLETELIEGRIDALLTPTPADEKKPAGERKLRSLIADVQTAEEEYVTKYGVYPINHVIVIRERHPSENPEAAARAVRSVFGRQKPRLQAPAWHDVDAVGYAPLEQGV